MRIAVPKEVSDSSVRLAIIERLGWIRKQQKVFEDQPRQSFRDIVSGESHYFQGRRYRLEVIERRGKHEVRRKNNQWLQLFVQPGTSRDNREKVINDWYRQHLKTVVPPMIAEWEDRLGVKANGWNIRLMRTRWGSCNTKAKTILLNLELAKKPPVCLEYIVVHELMHLLERSHNERFQALMDRYMPMWRQHRDLLQRSPLGEFGWGY